MRRWLVGPATAVFAIAAVGWWVYFETGLKEYVEVEWAIHEMSGEEKETARKQFTKDSEEIFDAILGPVSTHKQWLWLWAGGWPRRYEAGEAAIFTFYDICRAANNARGVGQNQGTFRIDDAVRFVTQDMGEWEEYAPKGSYVQVKIDTSGGRKKLVEAHAYRWPLFLPFRLEKLCVE